MSSRVYPGFETECLLGGESLQNRQKLKCEGLSHNGTHQNLCVSGLGHKEGVPNYSRFEMGHATSAHPNKGTLTRHKSRWMPAQNLQAIRTLRSAPSYPPRALPQHSPCNTHQTPSKYRRKTLAQVRIPWQTRPSSKAEHLHTRSTTCSVVFSETS